MTAVARTKMVIMVVAVVMVAIVMGYGCVPIKDDGKASDNDGGVLVFMVMVAVVMIVVCIKKDNIGSELWKENLLDVVD
ncbi:hypothetical protein D8674_038035 [Pyrus ussuriensis x Pyrus communis]|uniref:Transmembrane protein n=1 Tax=Pyrus ussuriensis x Pyrus communis TaxID=2448454 RepID=A0A5N5I6K8_9ROSA|nr:hypothetical protein D8674_038035 [Pyrus ussuriensis x Pyrus communis]